MGGGLLQVLILRDCMHLKEVSVLSPEHPRFPYLVGNKWGSKSRKEVVLTYVDCR